MRLFITALLIAVAGTVRAQMSKVTPKDNPEAYWNRMIGCSGSAESYNVTLRVTDTDVVAGKVDALMVEAGAPSQLGAAMYSYSYSNRPDGAQPRARQMSYSVPVKSAEKLAKKVSDIGELINYSMNRQNGGDAMKQLEERIAVLEGELENKDALEKMPSAAYFLRSRLNSLKHSREVCKAAGSRSSISVVLQPLPGDSKP
jgi:hypothetical protein